MMQWIFLWSITGRAMLEELKNTIETAVALNRDGIIDGDSFSGLIVREEENFSTRNLPVFLRKTPEDADREILLQSSL